MTSRANRPRLSSGSSRLITGPQTGNLRIGTCSWNYDSWVGLVYTKTRRRAVDYLPEYAQRFDTAEIDSWFYAIPDTASVAEYAGAVPATFRWTCKAPRQITLTHLRGSHGKSNLPNPDFLSHELFGRFVSAIEPILPATDAVMLEFEYLNHEKMPGGLNQFVDVLSGFLDRVRREVGGGIPIAIEPRNAGFLTTQWFRFLLSTETAHVFSQKQYMPQIAEVCQVHHDLIVQMPRAVIRLLGGDRREIETETGRVWNRIVQPRDREKEVIAGVVADFVKEGYATINVNNHYEGSAPLTVRSIRELLGFSAPA